MQDSGFRWDVRPTEGRLRLDQYLTRQIPNQSRSQIQRWIRSGQVQVNGSKTKAGYLLRTGDHVTFHPTSEPSPLPHPEAIPLKILFQDQDLAVIDKPAGLVSHIGAGIRSGTLVNALLYHLGPLEGGDPLRPGIVHRLDRQTSGAMVIARNNYAHRDLAQQFKNRTVRKEYLALVYGRPSTTSGTINLPLGRDPGNRKRISTRARRTRTAVTHYQLERVYGPFSLLRIRTETGRTHQIRAHLSDKGHPVVGDILYGGNRSRTLHDSRWRTAVTELKRFFLHAHLLEFRHPRTGELMRFTAPLPLELENFLAALASPGGLG